MPHSLHNPKCFAAHMGPWMIEPDWFRSTVDAIRSGLIKAQEKAYDDDDDGEKAQDETPYQVTPTGTAIIEISGPLMKQRSKFGGSTSTVEARKQIRQAVNDPGITSILLRIESPGGTVAGTAELAEEVRAANEQKPVFAQIEDLGASAAYWVASQARRIFANELAQVGSIGTIAVLYDTSKMAELQGVKVHVIATGEFKGAGTPGAPVTDEHVKYFQERVDDLNAHFLKAVKAGRSMPIDEVRKVADGRVHIAAKALAMKLIDGVQPIEATIKQLAREVKAEQQPAAPRRARAALDIAKEE